jgi:hypothetical protein
MALTDLRRTVTHQVTVLIAYDRIFGGSFGTIRFNVGRVHSLSLVQLNSEANSLGLHKPYHLRDDISTGYQAISAH